MLCNNASKFFVEINMKVSDFVNVSDYLLAISHDYHFLFSNWPELVNLLKNRPK